MDAGGSAIWAPRPRRGHITWNTPALGDAGDFTEARETLWTAWVGEVQVLDTN
ncbi:hypothetical protein [Streptomyces microflavus]|uniref:Uncharacterized protein n=1 Tax=Streptomyces microflavus TaxID=1919 RepID=A0ABV1QDX3_STRMI